MTVLKNWYQVLTEVKGHFSTLLYTRMESSPGSGTSRATLAQPPSPPWHSASPSYPQQLLTLLNDHKGVIFYSLPCKAIQCAITLQLSSPLHLISSLTARLINSGSVLCGDGKTTLLCNFWPFIESQKRLQILSGTTPLLYLWGCLSKDDMHSVSFSLQFLQNIWRKLSSR